MKHDRSGMRGEAFDSMALRRVNGLLSVVMGTAYPSRPLAGRGIPAVGANPTHGDVGQVGRCDLRKRCARCRLRHGGVVHSPGEEIWMPSYWSDFKSDTEMVGDGQFVAAGYPLAKPLSRPRCR